MENTVNMLPFDPNNSTVKEWVFLCEGALHLAQRGFPPHCMDKYPVEIMSEVDGARGVILEVENSSKRRVTFDYIIFSNGDVFCLMWEYPVQNPTSMQDIVDSLPLI